MLKSEKQPKNWQKTLKLINQCPICSKDYNKDTVKRFLDLNSSHLIHLTCNHCQSYFVAMIMEVGKSMSTIGMITDLNYEDTKRLHNKEAISLDETIEASKILKNHNFNLKK